MSYVALLSELYSRDSIRAAKRIANPGCYATSTQLLIAPLLPFLARPAWPSVFGMSGYSGAGTVVGPQDPNGRPTTIPKISAEDLNSGIRPYALTDHIHEREAGAHLSRLLPPGTENMRVAFVPTVAPWFSGIISVLSMPLSQQLSARKIKALYEKKYADERLVKLQKEIVEVKDVQAQHGWVVGGFQVHSQGDRAVVVVGATPCCGVVFSKPNRVSRVVWITS
jgi:N-acetyl-gamma-glutamyl-phosphate reductase/acetylglutamate kinase